MLNTCTPRHARTHLHALSHMHEAKTGRTAVENKQSTIAGADVNTPLSVINRLSSHKINKDVVKLSASSVNWTQLTSIDYFIQQTIHSAQAQMELLPRPTTIVHHKTHFNKFTEIIQIICSGIKLKISNRGAGEMALQVKSLSAHKKEC